MESGISARELRTGLGQILFSLVLVAAITLAFGLGTGYHFTTYGLTPTALVLTAIFIGVLRSSYDVLTRDVLKQLVVNGLYGLVLTLVFVVFQAPDVALSMLVVGSIAYPVVVLIAIARVRSRERDRSQERE